MSYVSRVKGVDKYKYSDILKLLAKPEGWFCKMKELQWNRSNIKRQVGIFIQVLTL